MNGSKENKETRSFLFSSIEGVGFFFFLEKKKRNKASQIGMLEERDIDRHKQKPKKDSRKNSPLPQND
jgi:hypothetical protein